MNTPQLILGSSSPARRQLLDRLGINYIVVSPDIDETPLPFEEVKAMVFRLAVEKAKKVASTYTDAIIIGADQVGILGDTILCKPLSEEKAIAQLRQVSNQMVRFYTGLCVLDGSTGAIQGCVETYDVYFRELSDTMIQSYLRKEQALNCAGSFRVEGLGMALIHKLDGDDYTALIGLPLIKLIEMLDKVSLDVLT
jgi:septum formation protein